MKRNIPIEFFRFVFICFICLWHFNNVATFLKHGYIAVEFFFILSGFYLYKNYRKNPKTDTFDYVLGRAKKLFPPFLISFLLLVVLDRKQYIYLPEYISPDSILEKYFIHFPELFLCQGLTFRSGINFPLWFVSVLLFASGVLHSMLKNYGEKSINLFFPVMSLFGFHYIIAEGLHISPEHSSFYWIHKGLIRGISEMSWGIIIAYMFEKWYLALTRHKIFVDIFGVVSIFGFMLIPFAVGNYDYLSLFFVPVIIVCSCTPNSIFQKLLKWNVWKVLGGLSMFMYFIHLFVAYIFWIWLCSIGIPKNALVLMYLISVVIAAYLLKKISFFVTNRWKTES